MFLTEAILAALLNFGYRIVFERSNNGYVVHFDRTEGRESVSAALLGELFGDLENRAQQLDDPGYRAPREANPDAARLAALEQAVSSMGHRMNFLFDRLLAAENAQAAAVPVDAGAVSGPMYWPPRTGAAAEIPAPGPTFTPRHLAVASAPDDRCTDFVRSGDGVGACARCGAGPEYHRTGTIGVDLSAADLLP